MPLDRGVENNPMTEGSNWMCIKHWTWKTSPFCFVTGAYIFCLPCSLLQAGSDFLSLVLALKCCRNMKKWACIVLGAREDELNYSHKVRAAAMIQLQKTLILSLACRIVMGCVSLGKFHKFECILYFWFAQHSSLFDRTHCLFVSSSSKPCRAPGSVLPLCQWQGGARARLGKCDTATVCQPLFSWWLGGVWCGLVLCVVVHLSLRWLWWWWWWWWWW